MATKRIVPRATGEGGIGRSDKLMGPSFFSETGLSSKVRTQEATIVTTNATPAVLWSKTIADNEVTQVTAKVVAGDAAGGHGASFTRACLVKKGTAGSTAAIKGSTNMGNDILVSATMNLSWSISGTNVLQLLATGDVGLTITWRGEITAITA